MRLYNNLTGLRWLRKYFKGSGRHGFLGLGSWATWLIPGHSSSKELRARRQSSVYSTFFGFEPSTGRWMSVAFQSQVRPCLSDAQMQPARDFSLMPATV